MKQFIAKVKYADIREIIVEADTIEEAQRKYAAGDFDENTVDFYAIEELSPLKEAVAKH